MKIFTCEQGSEEWLRLRSGIPTSSDFDKILTKGGKKSASQEPYMMALLAERMMGHPRDGFISKYMERGKQMESHAVNYYEFQKDVVTVPVGFMTDDNQLVGASPDRLVGEDGLLEIKCPKDETHVAYLLGSGTVFDAYRVQAMGQLWISGRAYVDVCSWHPEMPEAIVRTERDEDFIKLLEEAVLEFSVKLEAKSLELQERGWMEKKAPYQFPKETDEAFERWNKTGVI